MQYICNSCGKDLGGRNVTTCSACGSTAIRLVNQNPVPSAVAHPAAQPAPAHPVKKIVFPEISGKTLWTLIGLLLGAFIVLILLDNIDKISPALGKMLGKANQLETEGWYTGSTKPSTNLFDSGFFQDFARGLNSMDGMLGWIFILIVAIKVINSVMDSLKNLTGPDWSGVMGLFIPTTIALLMPNDLFKFATVLIGGLVLLRDKRSKQPSWQVLTIALVVVLGLWWIGLQYPTWPTRGNILISVSRFILHQFFTGVSWGWIAPYMVLIWFDFRAIRDWEKDGTGLETVHFILFSLSFVAGRLAFTNIKGEFLFISDNIKVLLSPFYLGLVFHLGVFIAISVKELIKTQVLRSNPKDPQITEKIWISQWGKLEIGIWMIFITAFMTGVLIKAQKWSSRSYIVVAIAMWFALWLPVGLTLGPLYKNPRIRMSLMPWIEEVLGDHGIFQFIVPVFFANDLTGASLNLLTAVVFFIKPAAEFFGLV